MSISATSRLGFLVTLLYLIFEYGRPQDLVSQLAAVRPGLILISILTLLLAVNLRHLHSTASHQRSCMVLLLLLMVIHVPFSENTGRAFFATQSFLMQFIVFMSIILYVNTVDRLRALMKFWILLMAYIAVNGIFGGGKAGSNFLEDENDFALLMNMMLPFGVFLFSCENSKKGKLFYLIASLLCFASIVASFSRGGFIGLLLVAFAIWLTSSRKFLLLCVGAVGVLVILNLPITHTGTLVPNTTYWQEMTTIVQDENKDFNKESRMEYWKSAWRMFLDHPFGVGPQNFPVLLVDYQSEYFGELNLWGKVAHSLWFTLLPELGIPGLLLYLSLLFANVRDIFYLKSRSVNLSDTLRYIHFLSLAFLTSLVGFLVSGTFLSVLYYPHYWYLAAMIVATRKIFDRSLASKIEPEGEKNEKLIDGVLYESR